MASLLILKEMRKHGSLCHEVSSGQKECVSIFVFGPLFVM